MGSQTPLRAAWCCTLFSPDLDESISAMRAWDTRYVLVGKEICPETARPHLQVYVVFNQQQRITSLKKIHATAHWEPAHGTFEENWHYCTKEGDFESWGNEPQCPGKREQHRWRTLLDLAKQGDLSAIDVADPGAYIMHYSSLKRIKRDHVVMPPDLQDVCGVWIHGPSGCGKSRKARSDYPSYHYKLPNKWWDGYQGQPHVIIDDVDKNHAALGYHFKIWADRYGFLAEEKNGSVAMRPLKIIITSQYAPADIWPGDQETVAAIKRRYQLIDLTPKFEFITAGTLVTANATETVYDLLAAKLLRD